jgi:hypothetical protein
VPSRACATGADAARATQAVFYVGAAHREALAALLQGACARTRCAAFTLTVR